VLAARSVVYRTLRPTPLLQHASLKAETGLEIWVKHENHNPTGAFKVRGGLNLISRLTETERRGVITASTGNHGQSIAMACRTERVPCTIVVPVGNNPEKNAAMRALGSTVVEHGRDFDEAREHAIRHARDTGKTLVTDGRETAFAVGAGTIALEVTQSVGAGRLPVIDTAYVPVGNGSLIVGIGTWLRYASPSTRVVGVQAEGAPSMTLSWRAGRPVETEKVATSAEGLATRVPVPEAVDAMRSLVDDMILLPEAAILEAQQDLTSELGVLVEAAGAAAWAACVADSASRSASLTIVTGSNLRTNSGRLAGPAC
jgi:threonine dehydratase